MSFAPRGKSGGVRGAQETALGAGNGEAGTQGPKAKQDASKGAAMDEHQDDDDRIDDFEDGLPPETRMLGYVLLVVALLLMIIGFIVMLTQLGH